MSAQPRPIARSFRHHQHGRQPFAEHVGVVHLLDVRRPDAEAAFDADGRILALRVRTLADLGGYLGPRGSTAGGMWRIMGTSVYEIPAIDFDIKGVHTNRMPTCPYRGAGAPDYLMKNWRRRRHADGLNRAQSCCLCRHPLTRGCPSDGARRAGAVAAPGRHIRMNPLTDLLSS